MCSKAWLNTKGRVSNKYIAVNHSYLFIQNLGFSGFRYFHKKILTHSVFHHRFNNIMVVPRSKKWSKYDKPPTTRARKIRQHFLSRPYSRCWWLILKWNGVSDELKMLMTLYAKIFYLIISIASILILLSTTKNWHRLSHRN